MFYLIQTSPFTSAIVQPNQLPQIQQTNIKCLSSTFSFSEPKAPGELIGWVASVVRRPPTNFQTTSSLKPLGQMKPYFICSLQGFGERKMAKMF